MNERQVQEEIEGLRAHLMQGLDRLRSLELLLQAGGAAAQEPTIDPGREILVADDDPINRKVIARMLDGLGRSYHTVQTGHEALAELERGLYRVVMLDVNMPDLDGLETTRRIRARFSPGPYVIALTAGSSAADRRKVMEAGMQDYLPKPVRRAELQDALTQAFGAAST